MSTEPAAAQSVVAIGLKFPYSSPTLSCAGPTAFCAVSLRTSHASANSAVQLPCESTTGQLVSHLAGRPLHGNGDRAMNKLSEQLDRWSKAKPYHLLLGAAAVATGVAIVALVVWTMLR